MPPPSYPLPFLEVRCTTICAENESVVLCAGYEGGYWRSERLAAHLLQWLPYVALDHTQQEEFSIATWLDQVELAAAHVYKTEKTKSRGELGEVMLHIACVQEFGTLPILCKLVLKTSHNDTVKGFDAVHMLPIANDEFEIWLGEAKFYTDARRAIVEALASIKDHILPSFLNTEKAMIYSHIPSHIPNAKQVRAIFRRSTSSDELMARAVFPVFVAYESSTIANSTEITAEFCELIKQEVTKLHNEFLEDGVKLMLRFQLIFLPLGSKAELISHFDKKLGAIT